MTHSWYQHYPPAVPKEISIDEHTSIAHAIEKTCQRHAQSEAIYCLGTTITFSQLDRMATRFASYLQNELKLVKGDRIAIMVPNLIQFPVAFLGAQKAGVICVNTNPLYTAREMQHQFSDSGAETIVILDLFLDKLEEIVGKTKIKNIVTTSIPEQMPALKGFIAGAVLRLKGMIPSHGLKTTTLKQALEIGARSEFKAVSISHDDIAILQYTGGTTGVAKGAMLTQKNILSNMAQIKSWAGDRLAEGDENVLTALPLYHIFALTVNFLTFLSMGSRMFLLPKPIPISNTVKMFKKHRINVLTGVNTLYNALNHDESFRQIAPKTIKVALAGGMALQEQVSKDWQKITGIEITEGFGLTEASPVTHCNPLFSDHPPNSIGIPLPSTNSKVVDTEGNEVATGEEGELLVKGPQVMKGYWQRPEETEKTIRDGWLWTGDVAKIDHSGYFYIVDRKKDMIIVSGFNVYPNEIEEILVTHPQVVECAVIGVEDSKSGEAVKAFIVAKDGGVSEEELRAHCDKNLVNYKRPKYYEYRDELPKTNVGKILRRMLREESN